VLIPPEPAVFLVLINSSKAMSFLRLKNIFKKN
jgi:hypothetical protein